MRSTSSPSPKSVTTHPVAPTTCANKPRERAAKKPSAHSSEESPTPSGDNYKSTLAPRVESGPGTTPRGDSYIQRGRLNPEHRHFGSVSSRTHSNDNPARTRRRQRHHPTRTRTLKPCLLTQRGFDLVVDIRPTVMNDSRVTDFPTERVKLMPEYSCDMPVRCDAGSWEDLNLPTDLVA